MSTTRKADARDLRAGDNFSSTGYIWRKCLRSRQVVIDHEPNYHGTEIWFSEGELTDYIIYPHGVAVVVNEKAEQR